MCSIALGISIGLTAVVLIQERKDGLMDRTWVAGVNVTEIIISQVVTQFFILLVQILLMMVFILWVFKVRHVHVHIHLYVAVAIHVLLLGCSVQTAMYVHVYQGCI